MDNNRQHAIVLGASMAGLLAARVLADEFERVTLVERDRLPAAADNRRGVPQGQPLRGSGPDGSVWSLASTYLHWNSGAASRMAVRALIAAI